MHKYNYYLLYICVRIFSNLTPKNTAIRKFLLELRKIIIDSVK